MQQKERRHTISLLVRNKPGVLIRISLVFARRGYNIDSVIASPTQDPLFSFVTIVAGGEESGLHNIIKQLQKLVDIVEVRDTTDSNTIQRELALIKIKIPPSERSAALQIAHSLDCSILDISESLVILEVSGPTGRVERVRHAFKEFEVLEFIRTGKVVMPYEEIPHAHITKKYSV